MKQFPKGFLWGAATSSHQVEGNTRNDWTEWERQNANRLAQEAHKRFGHLPNWPDIKTQAEDPQNYISGRACDHYNRFEEDFDIAKSLGHNAHRFSIEWSRIEPEEGKFDEKEIQHYRHVVRALRARGMEPIVTLWHWTHPIWFAQKGGWLHPDAVESFVRFARKIVGELKEVQYWLTLNEPETYMRHAYIKGSEPPGIRSVPKALHVMRTLIEAHRKTYVALKGERADIQVGFTESLVYFERYNTSPLTALTHRFLEWWRNESFVPKVVAYSDFVGVNYYFHIRIRVNPFVSYWGILFNDNKKVSDMGWELFPEGLYHVLKRAAKHGKPIFINEHGLADEHDTHREWYIRESLRWVHRAIEEGVPVKGYLHWSLLDNFEFPEVRGFWPRFGLVEVNFKTFERKIRSSANAYAQIAKSNSLND